MSELICVSMTKNIRYHVDEMFDSDMYISARSFICNDPSHKRKLISNKERAKRKRDEEADSE